MPIENSTKTAPQRIEIIDALRGFSLAGIVIVHLVENYIGGPAPQSFYEDVNQGLPDAIVSGFNGIFLSGKFFALFSFLFGVSFFIQMNNARANGSYFGWRFAWKMILLFGIGFVHSLFYAGDILTIYAMLGLLLIPFFKVGNKTIVVVAALLLLGVGRFVVFGLTHGEDFFGDVGMSPEHPHTLEYFNVLKSGTIGDVFSINAVDGHLRKMNFQYGIFGRGYMTLAYFLIGMLVGRIGFFNDYQNRKKLLKRSWITGLVLFLVSGGLLALTFGQMGGNITFDNWLAMFGLTAVDLSNISITLLILSVFVLLYKKTKARAWLSKFAPYGRMALTNYFFQSVIGTVLFFGWGFGLIGQLRNIYTFGIAIGIIIVQMALSKLWLKHFKYGPLEWLWRSLTFFKLMPLKK
ncbi:MAG: DUF418 domain-containing protein [Bacteroidota bacterium]